MNRLHTLIDENARLKKALSDLIPWAGEPCEGPDWATEEAKIKNKGMCEQAIKNACALFPVNYDGNLEVNRGDLSQDT